MSLFQALCLSGERRITLPVAVSGFMAGASLAQAASLDVPYVPTPSDVVISPADTAETVLKGECR